MDVSSKRKSPSVAPTLEAAEPHPDAAEDADVHAFLIADVRGYTSFTQERGDEGAARLAGRFAEVTRSVVGDHRGRVLELRGDEALVVFGSPRSAIRGAVALQQRYLEETIADPSLPLTVGIGLDAGEAVPIEGGYRGAALNVAARLCSLARAGEVLASQEIVHLARRVDGVRFADRGQVNLKGLEQPVHVVVVRSEERDAVEGIAPFIRSTPPPPASHRRRKVAAVGIAFALIAATVIVTLARQAGGSSEIAPNSIGILDPKSGELRATVALAGRPGAVAASSDAVWVTNPDIGTVTRIDPIDRDVHDSVPVGEDPTGIAVGFGAVWVVESGGPSVSRISPETNSVVGDAIEVGNGPASIALGEAGAWVTNRLDGTISRIDPDRGEVVETIPVGLDPRGIALGFGSVWVALAGSNTVVRIDPDTGSVTQPIGVGNSPGSLAVGGDAVWVVNTLDDTVSRIDPDTNTVVDVIRVGDGPSGIAVAQGTLWVSNEADGTLSRLEPDQTSASKVVIGSVPQGLAVVNGDLWVTVRGTATSHRGGTLRVVGLEVPPTLDPSVAYDYLSWRVLHLIGDGLVAFEPTGGTNTRLLPDLATSVPTPTDGGRTYTFGLRPGIRYSSGGVVAPTDFRRAIERGFHQDAYTRSVYGDIFGRIVGATTCAETPRTCDLSQGIVTDDSTITFNLVDPDPEFLSKLTMGFAYPVPPSTPGKQQVKAGIPGTGPYMLDAPMTDEGLVLVRNPHFRVWSPEAQPDGYVDRIEWTFRVEPNEQVDAVATNEADLALNAEASERPEEIFVRYAGRIHSSPDAKTFYLVLNTDSAPFDDPEVRRALNFALDRRRVVQIFGGDGTALPTCQQLPPNFPGYEPYCPFTSDPGPGGEGAWTAPDLTTANAMVRRSGTSGMRIVFEYPDFWGAQGKALGKYLVQLLHELGYRASVKTVSLGSFYSPDHEFQMALDGWGQDYPAASNFIANRFTCDAHLVPSAGLCDPGIDAMIDHASRVQARDPAASGPLWAAIDRAIVDQAPYVWLVNPIQLGFVSERAGNYQFNSQWGVLLNQLWVR